MQRFTYTEPRNLPEAENRETLSICMGACNTSVPESEGKYINNEFYCDACAICCCCGKPAVMDEGHGLTCSPSRLVPIPATGGLTGWVVIHEVVCNGSLQDAEGADEAVKDQMDWDNGAYNG